ncbi:golgin candidate 5 [Prunus dulcis]|uniref:Golgin candidate 5 n=1 Tax=Prunus dulcis TaxID=3755 RepID=A0A5H2Y245_PRUDU|nr:golgin candidate 5 [Prunus dulcis]
MIAGVCSYKGKGHAWREQNKKSDAAALLKEKDEIINQVKSFQKQAAQEGQIRKLGLREFEEEKKGLITKLQSIS